MVFGCRKHVHDTSASSLLTKLHLEDSIVDRFAGDLSSEHIQLAVGDFEVGGRVFVLAGGEQHKRPAVRGIGTKVGAPPSLEAS